MFRSNLSLGSFGFRDIEISGFGVVPMHVSSPVNGVFIKKNFNDYIQTLREKMRSSEPLTLEKKDAVFKELEQRLRDGDGQTLWHNVFSFLINHLDNRKLRESLQVDSEIQNIFVEELIDVIKDFLIRCMDSDIYPTHLVVKVTLEQIKNTIFFGFEDHTGNVPVKRAIFKVDLSSKEITI